MKNGGEPIYTGEQGKNLCIFAKMPYISNQMGKTVFWNEITADNEKNCSCVIEKAKDADSSGLSKHQMRKSKDMKKGIKQGLKHRIFKYDYAL